jgi:antirestriction protein ArdC
MMTEAKDLYQRVTEQIVAAIEAGVEAGRMPWHRTGESQSFPLNAATRNPYRGINVLALWAAAAERSYPTGVWATYKQWQELDAHVRRGERGTLAVYWKLAERDAETDADEENENGTAERRFFAQSFFVFNAAQVTGYTPATPLVLSEAERIESAERFFNTLGADIRHGGEEAYYWPTTDHIQMPPFGAFTDPGAYYSVLAHEATHWTGNEKRLARELSNRFGSDAYAVEELVAELGAAFICAGLGIDSEPRPDHAAYLASWLRVLRSDKRAIFAAAGKAQQAVDWMNDR